MIRLAAISTASAGTNPVRSKTDRRVAVLSLLAVLVPLQPAAAEDRRPLAVSDGAPIVNWRLPSFTPDGRREWLVRGSEARLISPTEIDVKGLTLAVFATEVDSHTRTFLLSPSARFFPETITATGVDAIRVIDDEFEASGIGWSYRHREKRISIAKNVRVTFRAELKDLLK